MKKTVFGVLLLMCIATLVFAQSGSRVMISGYNYSALYVAEDSSGSITWTLDGLNGDIDTSERIDISMYHDVGSKIHFSSIGAPHNDSLQLSIYGIVSWNDTTYIVVDSLAGGPLSWTEVTVGCSGIGGAADSCFYKDWTLPPARYFKIVVMTYQDKTALPNNGITMTILNMRQP